MIIKGVRMTFVPKKPKYAGGLYKASDPNISGYRIVCMTTEDPIDRGIKIDNLEPIEEFCGSENKVKKALTKAIQDYGKQNPNSEIQFTGDLAEEILEEFQRYRDDLTHRIQEVPIGY